MNDLTINDKTDPILYFMPWESGQVMKKYHFLFASKVFQGSEMVRVPKLLYLYAIT